MFAAAAAAAAAVVAPMRTWEYPVRPTGRPAGCCCFPSLRTTDRLTDRKLLTVDRRLDSHVPLKQPSRLSLPGRQP